MAISFSRPDPSSPSAVAGASFPASRRGFDQTEVRDFLRMVAAELGRLQERERFLESELRAIQTRGLSGPGRLDEETVTALLGEEAARVLTTAREASISIRERAEESATRLVKEATEDATRIREAATADAQRIRDDATVDANSEIEMAKQQGRDMVNEARAYREKVLSELSRRRDAARAQIEQLLHGRDRLLSAFERARIATESVLGELHDAHDEPETLVSLSPTTGPVPVVNPHHPSVAAYDQEAEQHLEKVAAEARELIDAQPSTIDIPLESILDGDPVDTSGVEADITPPEEESHPVFVDDRRRTAPATADNRASDEPVDVPSVDIPSAHVKAAADPAPAGTGTVSNDTGTVSNDTGTLSNDTGTVSNVVSLFDRRPQAVPDLPVETERTTPVRPADTSADDIFARLRKADTEKVARQTSTRGTGDTRKATKASGAKDKAASKSTPAPIVAVVDPKRFTQRDKTVAPLVADAVRKLKRALADEQNGVLEHLRNKRSSLNIDAVLGTEGEHAARLATAITDESMSSASGGVRSVRASGATPKRVTKKAVDSVVSSVLASGLVTAFREDARVALGEAEGDRNLAADLMRDVYRKWKNTGLEGLAEDAMCAAHNAGAYLSLDPSTSIVWMVDPARECCSDCADNALAGALVKGTDFPTGHPHPMSHPGCRCLIGPASS